MMRARRHRGIALVTALLITAITAAVATNMAADNALDARRTMVLLFHEQGKLVASGAESWVRNILQDDSIDTPTDHLGEIWAQELPALPVDNGFVQGVVTGELEDLQGRFNVNLLIGSDGRADPDYLQQFQDLLEILELDPRYAGLAVDWLDADQDASFPYGAEDPIYTAQVPPYRTYNRALTNVTELAALEGMTQAEFDVLRPHITALPTNNWKVNVNTATAAVLRSLGPANIDQTTAESLIEQRAETGFPDGQVLSVFGPLVRPELQDKYDEVSSYFQLKAIVQIDTVRVTYYSVLHRAGQGGPVSVLMRSLGTL